MVYIFSKCNHNWDWIIILKLLYHYTYDLKKNNWWYCILVYICVAEAFSLFCIEEFLISVNIMYFSYIHTVRYCRVTYFRKKFLRISLTYVYPISKTFILETFCTNLWVIQVKWHFGSIFNRRLKLLYHHQAVVCRAVTTSKVSKVLALPLLLEY